MLNPTLPGGASPDRLPLGFADFAQFRRCGRELGLALAAEGASGEALVIGTAATFGSFNVRQRSDRHHFDALGPNTSDIDIVLRSRELLEKTMEANTDVDRRDLGNDGRPLWFDSQGPRGLLALCPRLAAFVDSWSRQLGRAVDLRLLLTLPGQSDSALGFSPPPIVLVPMVPQVEVVQEGDARLALFLGPGRKTAMRFVLIRAGSFVMGQEASAEGALGEEEGKRLMPPHPVTLTKDFWMQTTPVTQAQWTAVMGSNPSEFRGPERPVENVSWEDCKTFLGTLNMGLREAFPGKVAALPTEAQWEYACRAGTTTRWSFGSDASRLGDYAWYESNAGGETHPVGLKLPNPWGLYDMYGNVGEWCADWGAPEAGGPVDPAGPAAGNLRVLRGHSWDDGAHLGSAFRYGDRPDESCKYVGFRVALV